MILIQYVGTEAGLEWYWFVTSHIGHFCLELSKNDFIQLHYFLHYLVLGHLQPKKLPAMIKKKLSQFFDKI